jgi:hypothetical protein
LKHAFVRNLKDGSDMKLRKALRGYYKDQVDAVNIAGGIPLMKTNGRGAGSRMFNFVFHAVLIGLIVTAMLLGRHQQSLLNQQMEIIINRYNVEDRMTDSLESLIIIIKKNRNAGGK